MAIQQFIAVHCIHPTVLMLSTEVNVNPRGSFRRGPHDEVGCTTVPGVRVCVDGDLSCMTYVGGCQAYYFILSSQSSLQIYNTVYNTVNNTVYNTVFVHLYIRHGRWYERRPGQNRHRPCLLYLLSVSAGMVAYGGRGASASHALPLSSTNDTRVNLSLSLSLSLGRISLDSFDN